MIVLFVLGIVMLAYAAIRGVTHRKVRWGSIVLGIILTVSMGFGLHQAQQDRFLLARVPVAKTEKIAPAITVNGLHLITTQKVADKELRYTYAIGDKSYQTVTENASTFVKTTDRQQATLKTQVVTYQANSLWRRLLLLGQQTLEKGHTTFTLTIPKDWYVVPANKVVQLQQMVKDSKASIANETGKQVKQSFMDKAAADEGFVKDTKAQDELKKKIINDVTKQADDKLLQDMQAQLAKWQ